MGATCFVKLEGFWFVTMTEIENTSVSIESVFFLPYFLLFCFFAITFCLSTAGKTKCVAVPFHQLNSEIKRRCFVDVSPLYSSLWDDNFFELDLPPVVQLLRSPWSKSSYWARRERSWSASQHKSFVFVFFLLSMSYFCQVWQLIKLK